MIEELEVVALTRAVPEHGLEAGDVGTIVMVHEAARGYTVEFMDLRGNTLAIADLPADARSARCATGKWRMCGRSREQTSMM